VSRIASGSADAWSKWCIRCGLLDTMRSLPVRDAIKFTAKAKGIELTFEAAPGYPFGFLFIAAAIAILRP
jgi:hypothetical protein